MTDLWLCLVAGFLSSVHCAGMCGAIILAYSTQPGVTAPARVASPSRRSVVSGVPSHLAYNGGRVISYTLLGAMAGIFGSFIGSVHAIGPWVSLVAGVVMLATGVHMLDLFPGIKRRSPNGPSWLRTRHLRTLTGLLSLGTLESRLYIGLLTPFLPCGILYAMFLKAAATQNGLDGASTMLAFGLGMVPALLLAGLLSVYAGFRLKRYAHRLAAATILLMGLAMIARGVGLPFPGAPMRMSCNSFPVGVYYFFDKDPGAGTCRLNSSKEFSSSEPIDSATSSSPCPCFRTSAGVTPMRTSQCS